MVPRGAVVDVEAVAVRVVALTRVTPSKTNPDGPTTFAPGVKFEPWSVTSNVVPRVKVLRSIEVTFGESMIVRHPGQVPLPASGLVTLTTGEASGTFGPTLTSASRLLESTKDVDTSPSPLILTTAPGLKPEPLKVISRLLAPRPRKTCRSR